MKRYFARLALVAAGCLLFGIVAGCSEAGSSQDQAGHAGHGAHLPDNMVATASFDELPSFLKDYTETTKSFYAQVDEHADILQNLNCYCGCMSYNDPHDSLYRCFVIGSSNEEVQWTDHGASCGICLMELRDVIQLAGEGKTADEIKQHIDSTYGGSGQSA